MTADDLTQLSERRRLQRLRNPQMQDLRVRSGYLWNGYRRWCANSLAHRSLCPVSVAPSLTIAPHPRTRIVQFHDRHGVEENRELLLDGLTIVIELRLGSAPSHRPIDLDPCLDDRNPTLLERVSALGERTGEDKPL